MGLRLFHCVCFLLSLSMLSCAPVVVMQTSTSDLELEVDAYVKQYPNLEIAYDFWSPDGVPFISFFNSTDDTILVDLTKSRVNLVNARISESFEDAILLQVGNRSFLDVYPDAEFRFSNRRLQLVLLPQAWTSIYGPGCYSPRNVQRGGGMEFNYVFSRNELVDEITHNFGSTPLTRLKQNEIDAYQRTEAGPDQYFINSQSEEVNLNTVNIILEVLTAILFVI